MKDKKLLLRVVFKLMSLAGLGFVIYILFAGFIGADKDESIIYIDISKISKGEVNYFEVINKKLLVLRRTEAMLNQLPHQNSEYFIAYAYDPVFGCAVEFINNYFKSVCVDIKYDLAGRVYKNSRSARNLIEPEYKFSGSGQVVILVN